MYAGVGSFPNFAGLELSQTREEKKVNITANPMIRLGFSQEFQP